MSNIDITFEGKYLKFFNNIFKFLEIKEKLNALQILNAKEYGIANISLPLNIIGERFKKNSKNNKIKIRISIDIYKENDTKKITLYLRTADKNDCKILTKKEIESVIDYINSSVSQEDLP